MVLLSNVSLYRVVILLALGCGACRSTNSNMSVSDVAPEAILTYALTEVSTDTARFRFDGLRKRESVIHYYQRFGRVPVWIKDARPTGLADSMMHIIRDAARYGFRSERYHLTELDTFSSFLSKERLQRNEILLTDAFFCFVMDLKVGMRQSDKTSLVDSAQIELLHNVVSNGHLIGAFKLQEPDGKRYQSLRRGLGLLIDSLTSVNDDSIEQNATVRLVAINLERWRTESVDFSQRHIFINIPSYVLDVVEHDTLIFSSSIIVGKPDAETPILSSVVECFTIYPYWHVPRKIAVEEYLPFIKNDTSFIRKNNFDVLDRKGRLLNPDSIEWNKFSQNYFPVVLRQREGSENSLGVIKFIFDNPYAVYLHDTNAKRLFKSRQRAFSHGCIRMEKAVELAHYLVTDRVGGESKTVSKYLKEKQQHWVDLKRPIPIYTRYITCEFRNGRFYLYPDIYQKDQHLYNLLDAITPAFDL